MKKTLATAIIATLMVLGGTTSAMAADPGNASPQGLCSGSRIVFKSTTTGGPFVQASQPNSSVSGGPGVTLGISTSTSFTVSGSITATTGITVSNVVASVKADVGVTIGASKTGTTTNSGSWTVPATWNVGRLAIGTAKYSGTTKRYLENSACTLVLQNSTSYNAPQQEWRFQTSRVS
ncbi:hypothetical protein [Marisediminicola antarctica]|uniref:hypothetical protein n=1 Tax=Marisediminicola antarctica TaxID=674079 RepID=UPI001379663C|nr:hypothetical protein [Marisediminicola antarctica]